ncbi:phosphoglycerate mutase family protein-like protein [Aaosphaeria arxii CBS 175.79]|uniref:Phosphoglycerate mutase family protein-like protein n=1 Tax=Aaosphaeria arxii CBS 175.79 TaxID=1450172 RepID=A0A6A5Y7M3_9PLEO|nr:phosphoglycerate mutase family protein-like protein [Aaosphaeria arxii CBS 175.79]KAF2021007.1 phosphoglycerate mutase family protein-like protein [Aaosphaeria arxii CBS 175.79]
MPPTIYLVRHAQGEHNATRNYTILDPLLTAKGKQQCQDLKKAFPFHNEIDLVVASPLRRTVQTAALSFGPTLARKEVPFIALPVAQEVSNTKSDTGLEIEELLESLPTLFSNDQLEFDVHSKLDLSLLEKGWTSKQGQYAYTKEAILKRAAGLRSWLYQRPEKNIILVSHGAFMHFFTEDLDTVDAMTSTAYLNCELRIFTFTPSSTEDDAHVQETPESRTTRGANQRERDPHVLEEIETVTVQA